MRLWALFLILSLAVAAPTTLKPPSEDDFYNPPDGYEDEELGTILKWRTPPARIRSIYFPVNVQNTWQMLVRSEDEYGNATAIVSTIFEPYNANSSRLVAYNVAEDASSIDCSPSYTFEGGGGIGTIIGKAEMILIQGALELGYYVVSTDYESSIGAFTAGPLSGISVLNTIKATLTTSNTTGINPDCEIVLWGYSGGTIPGGWAAAMQPSYYEELTGQLKGAALGGWVTNITATAEIIDGTIFAGLTPNAITGLAKQYPAINDAINEYITDKTENEDFNSAPDYCLLPSVLHYAYDQFFTGPDPWAKSGWSILSEERVKTVLNANTLGIDATKEYFPEIPMFVFHGRKDEVVPFKDAQRVYDVWCDAGIESFEFATSNSTGHILEVIEGSGAALKWISDIFNGVPPIKGCKQTSRSTNLLYPGAYKGYYEILTALIENVAGTKIGPSDSENVKRWLEPELKKRGKL
ncbi:hypothetical protein PSN45_003956 [Yamadazyma tenuis]|uniref:LIP-domain-containing protein n=1 Tax=Candida tenuis (strain ATCC 10573 / BCRC 21748 / CBS 615 / JCM 9827 / NBRC 10315 / NRRL Y-1498 / VKM Y-70) TaxID=590646 RepID=G3B4K3_CANTC|nr:LIP-domain-containing protein [Yamadazyma tenuis ATCC 10573]XP_006686620.1 uncharacterized protein CANTEDRAFT_114003 [Yamadazyma tenuis ATCC 10573]EGV64305.1 LIP-domain-containing protein [Yamadazyma tenuis ATCC 10573]EGV64306.1 hypothetical protein CANTEDRAFT_114003 [Yamadazyma tenuis ATCC 10573]WEJ96417.1 hypothetical protein PSN45_003956 [Yamadazyma tenuis]